MQDMRYLRYKLKDCEFGFSPEERRKRDNINGDDVAGGIDE